ncbi:MAG: 50S ribosomal protein L18 [Pseudomonadota bacterium]
MTSLKYYRQSKRRAARVRRGLKGAAYPRLSVFRSNKHIYAQIIDDVNGKTLVSFSTKAVEFKKLSIPSHDIAAAKKVGEYIGKYAVDNGVKKVVFDKGPYLYHGKVAELANAARAAGLVF